MSVFTDIIEKAKNVIPFDKLLMQEPAEHEEGELPFDEEAPVTEQEEPASSEEVEPASSEQSKPLPPKKKLVFRHFTPAGYMEETAFLEKMQADGWQLVKIHAPGIYCFEPCEAGDVVYQLDYCSVESRFEDGYFYTFSRNGWEYVLTYAGYRYFRRSADIADGDSSILCSDDERIDLVEAICKRVFMPFFVLTFLLAALHLRSGAAGMWSVLFLLGAVCSGAVLLYYYNKYKKLLKRLGIYY